MEELIDNSGQSCSSDVMEAAEFASVGCGFHMKNPSDADADLLPDQNLLVPAIIATAMQLSYFRIRL